MSLSEFFGYKFCISPLLTKTIDHGIRRRVLIDQIIWERWVEEVPDNDIYFLPGDNMIIASSLTMEVLKKSMDYMDRKFLGAC